MIDETTGKLITREKGLLLSIGINNWSQFEL